MTFIPLFVLHINLQVRRAERLFSSHLGLFFTFASEGLRKAHRRCLFMTLLLGSEPGVSTVFTQRSRYLLFLFSSLLFVLFLFHFLCASSLLPIPSPSPTGLRREQASGSCLSTARKPPSSGLCTNAFASFNCSPVQTFTREEPRRFSDPVCVCVLVTQQ